MAVYKELSDKIKFGLNKMGIAARKLQLGNFLDEIGSFGKLIIDYEEGNEPIELLEKDLPANQTVFIEVKNSDDEATLTVPSGVLKLYAVQNSSDNALNFTPKDGTAYSISAGVTVILAEGTKGEFSLLGGGDTSDLASQINDIANQIEDLQNSGVDTTARNAIAGILDQLEGFENSGIDEEARAQISDIANQKGEPDGLATLDSSGKVPLAQLPEGTGGEGVDSVARAAIADLEEELEDKVDKSQVLTDVPENAVFTDTITTINGKTGAITKADIVALGIPAQDTVTTINGKTGAITKSDITALGIPAQDTVYTHPASHSMSEVEGLQAALAAIPTIHVSATNPTLEDGEEGDFWFVLPPTPTDPEDPEDPDDPTIFRYYTEGVENGEWVQGHRSGTNAPIQSKEVDHLYMEILENVGASEATFIRDIPIDLTYVSEVCFEAEVLDAASGFGARFAVSTEKNTGNSSGFLAAFAEVGSDKSRKVYTIDVSGLSGFHYLRAAARDSSSTEVTPGKLKVYNVWVVASVQPAEPESPYVNYYTEGTENVEWVEAYSTGDETYGTQSKESDHLYIEIFAKTGIAINRTYATKDPVDVTSLKQIEINMRTSEIVACAIRFGVAVARDTSNSSSNYVVKADVSAKPSGYTSIMDVSELTGEYYIRMCLMNASSTASRPGQLRVYNVRGVKDV